MSDYADAHSAALAVEVTAASSESGPGQSEAGLADDPTQVLWTEQVRDGLTGVLVGVCEVSDDRCGRPAVSRVGVRGICNLACRHRVEGWRQQKVGTGDPRQLVLHCVGRTYDLLVIGKRRATAFAVALGVVSVVGSACGSSEDTKPDPGFTARGLVIATASGLNAYMRTFQNCDITTSDGTITENSAVTISHNGKIVGSGTLSAPSYKKTDLGGACSFSFSIPVSETDDATNYPYSVRLADNSSWSANLTTLRDDGFNIGITDKSFDSN